MLEEYMGRCGPYSAFLNVASLNAPVSETNEDDGDVIPELVDTLPSPLPNPEDEYLQQDILNKIGGFVDALPANLKLVAMLHYWDGLTQSEIARILGISQSAVSQRLSKVVALGRAHFGLTAH